MRPFLNRRCAFEKIHLTAPCWVLNEVCNRLGRNKHTLKLKSNNSTQFAISPNANETPESPRCLFFKRQHIQSDHPAERAAYSNAIKPSPRGHGNARVFRASDRYKRDQCEREKKLSLRRSEDCLQNNSLLSASCFPEESPRRTDNILRTGARV